MQCVNGMEICIMYLQLTYIATCIYQVELSNIQSINKITNLYMYKYNAKYSILQLDDVAIISHVQYT